MRLQIWVAAILLAFVAVCAASAQELALQCDPPQTVAKWNLSDPLHTVKGDFKSKQCQLHYNPATHQVQGQVTFDATSGQSGNGTRDRKMHKDVLESKKYPEIIFHPDRIDGTVAAHGASSLQVHGIFTIHGEDHEVTLPVDFNLNPPNWTARAHFSVPYVKWGMKNPSLLFLHVGDVVAVDFEAAGSVSSDAAQVHQ